MSNEYDPFKDRLDEKLYDEELEPIRQKFIQYLYENKVDPVKMHITKLVVEGVIKLMGKDYPDYKVFTFPIPEKDWIRRGMEDLKAHLPSERHQTGRLARFAHCKLTTPEREPEEGPQASGEYLFYDTKELHTCTEEEETSTTLH